MWLHPEPALSTADTDTIATNLPHRSLYPGDIFEVTVVSRFHRHLQTAVVEAAARDGLEIMEVKRFGNEIETVSIKNLLPAGPVFVISAFSNQRIEN